MYHEIVVAGIAISLIFTELTGLSPAGLVVPGYIVLSLQNPKRVIYTIFLALAVWGVVKLLSNSVILYGRRQFAMAIILAYVIDTLICSVGNLPYNLGAIGVLVPGIIAQEMVKQGIAKSLLSLAVVVGILVLLMMWHGMRVFPV